jgi:hypothetical protein
MGSQAKLVRHPKPKGGEPDRPSRIATIEGPNGARPEKASKWEWPVGLNTCTVLSERAYDHAACEG